MGLMEMVVCLMLATVAMGQTNRTTGQLPLTATMQGTDTLLVETGLVAGAQSTRRISVATFESLFGGGSSGSGILTGTNAGVVFTFNAAGQLILSNSVNGNMMVWNNGQLTVNGVVVLTNASAFDPANAALKATNNLGALAFQNTVTPTMVTNASGFWAAAPGASLPLLGGGANTIVTNGEPSVSLGIVYTANLGQPFESTPGIWTNDVGYIYYGGIKTTNVFAGPILAPQFMLPVASITAGGTASAQTFLRGDASWQPVDSYGAAQSATNGYVWGVLYDPANSAWSATNGYPWSILYDPVNAARNATNGYPWSGFYDSAGAAQKATNNLGTLAFENNVLPSQITNVSGFWAAAPGSNLNGQTLTNSFDATNAAFNALKTATNSFQGTNASLSVLAAGNAGALTNLSLLGMAMTSTQVVQAITSAEIGSLLPHNFATQLLPVGYTNFTVDFNLGSSFYIYATNNIWFTAATNVVPGYAVQVMIIQDTVGTRTVGWTNNWKFSYGLVPLNTTNASAVDLLQVTGRTTLTGGLTNVAVQLYPDFR